MYVRTRFMMLGVWIAIVVALAVLWAVLPMEELRAPGWFDEHAPAERPLLLAAILAAFVIALQVAVPQLLLTAAVTVILGPWWGLAVAFSGTLLGAALTYTLGRWLARRPLRRYAGPRIMRLSRMLARRGLINMAVINLVPFAPYPLINLAAGTSHLRWRDFLGGTALGVLPSTLVAVFGTQFLLGLGRAPTAIEALIATLLLAAGLIGLLLFTRWAWGWLSGEA